MNINLNIERLILDGIDIQQHQKPELQSALESELASLLEENGISTRWASSDSVPRLSADSIRLPESGAPNEFGQTIAQSIYKGIQR